MIEKSQEKRLPIDLELEISSLFHQDNVKVENIDAPIEVMDISKSGVGFKSASILPVDYYFNAKLRLGDESSLLYVVVKIIRVARINDNEFFYGCEFIGLAPVLHYIFDSYEQELKAKGMYREV